MNACSLLVYVEYI